MFFYFTGFPYTAAAVCLYVKTELPKHGRVSLIQEEGLLCDLIFKGTSASGVTSNEFGTSQIETFGCNVGGFEKG